MPALCVAQSHQLTSLDLVALKTSAKAGLALRPVEWQSVLAFLTTKRQ